MRYVGRFAPSPTGSLHLGTLTAAVASFLHARQAGGEWLVRIEDIDPPREVPGSAESILKTLEALDLEWDRDVVYQSRKLAAYLDHARALVAAGDAYYCDCSRQQIRKLTGGARYPGTCREKRLGPGDTAIRLRVERGDVAFTDRLQGKVVRDIAAADGDFIVARRDGLPAYHLAVVLDDADSGVSDVVRGADLLEVTPLHVYLQRKLGLARPEYWHIPLVTNAAGEKLSKRMGAAPIARLGPERAAFAALAHLGVEPPAALAGASPKSLWQWALEHWRIGRLARKSG